MSGGEKLPKWYFQSNLKEDGGRGGGVQKSVQWGIVDKKEKNFGSESSTSNPDDNNDDEDFHHRSWIRNCNNIDKGYNYHPPFNEYSSYCQ